jgi:hypothetical protein
LLGVVLLVGGHCARAAQITFQTEAGCPRITSTNPQNHAISVLTNTFLSVTFDSDMDVTTLNTTNIKLVNLSTGEIAPGWSAAAVASTFNSFSTTANLNLESNTTYALVLTTDVHSTAGKSLDPTDPLHRSGTFFGEAWVLEFTTGVNPLTTIIRQTNIGNIIGGPTGGQTDVPVTAIIRVGFERAMMASTINSTNIVLKKAGDSAPIATTVTYDTVANTAIITPTAALEYSTTYILTLTGLLDILGVALP